MRPSDDKATRWWWVRHAPVPHLKHQIYGNLDVDCDTTDESAFKWLAARLPKDAVWYISNLKRTHETASAVEAAGFPVPELNVAAAIGEQHLGDLHGRLHVEEEARRTDAFVGFWPISPLVDVPGGESFGDLCTRVDDFIASVNEKHPGRDIICISHCGPILAAIRLALNLDPTSAVSFAVSHLSLTRIHHYGSGRSGGPRYRVFCVASNGLVSY